MARRDMANVAERLLIAIQAVVPSVTDVAIGSLSDKNTWTVSPASAQAAAQATIDAFDPNDPAHDVAELDQTVKQRLDEERIFSAIVWTILDTYSAPATVNKYNAARTKIVAAYKDRPWLA